MFLLIIFALLNQNTDAQPFAPELFPPSRSGAVCGFSPDGDTIYFVREDSTAGKLFIYQAVWQNGRWNNDQLITFSGKHNDMGGRLSEDGKTFYFTSDRPGGSSKQEDIWNIWMSELGPDGWSEPQPAALNTPDDECCPTPLPNDELLFSASLKGKAGWQIYSTTANDTGKLNDAAAWQWPSFFDTKSGILFFNSMKRPDTRGMDDIYVAFRKNGQWTKPLNMGATVNSAVYEDGAILSPDGKWLIFNRHETHATPSLVLCVPWPPLLELLLSQE